MNKEHTVKDNRLFNEIIKNSRFVKTDSLVIYYRKNNIDNYRFGISVSKKLGNAVKRNRYKRQMRFLINKYKNNYQNDFDYIIIIRNGYIDLDFSQKEKDFIHLINLIDEKGDNMIKSKKKLILILIIMMVFLSGCTKQLKDKDGKMVKNEVTGQGVTENILCQPSDEKIIEIYKNNNIDISKLPTCKSFNMTSGGYEGLWESIFVKPLAWAILSIGFLVGSMGLGLIISAVLIRLAVSPLTQKAAKQSQLLNKAKPEIDKIEKKYKDNKDKDAMMKKSQEISMVYKKFNINPISGCIMAFLQLPLFIGFLEAINRVPAIFEEKFLLFQLGTTPLVAITNGNYVYLILILLVGVSTYYSLRNNAMASQNNDSMQMMNKVMFFMILFMSIFMTSALNIYWITTNLFMIGQSVLIKRKKE